VAEKPQSAVPREGRWKGYGHIDGPAARYRGNWHAALAAYRRWVGTWYKPAAPRKKWFREAFNFRQVFLHPNLGLEYGAFDPKTGEFRLAKMVADDAAAFGGVDFVHIFDWSQTPAHGRVGRYDPWKYLGGARRFRGEIARVKVMGILPHHPLRFAAGQRPGGRQEHLLQR